MYGFRVTGESGQLQVYSEGRNIALIKKGTVSVPAGSIASANQQTVVSLGNYGVEAMLFIRPSTLGAAMVAELKREASGNLIGVFAAETAMQGTWYLFAPAPKVAAAGTYGMQVYKEDGTVAYSTASKPLKVVSMFKIPDGIDFDGLLSSHVVNLPSGKTYAGCLSVPRGYIDREGPPDGGGPYSYFHKDAIYVTGSSVGTKDAMCETISGTAGIELMAYGGLLVIADVTGY